MTLDSILWFVLVLGFIGLIVGAVARLLVPGPTPMGILGTIGAGIAGAFIGGFIGRALFGSSLTNMWSFVLAVLAAVGIIWLISGRHGTYGYGRRVLVDDDPGYRPVARRRRFF